MRKINRSELARRQMHAKVLEARIKSSKKRFSESENKQATVTFVALPKFRYDQSDVSDKAFDYSFDDTILYNSYGGFDPSKDVSRMVKADFDEFGEKGLAQYIGDYEGELKDCVESIIGRFDSKKDQLYLTCKLTPGLNPYSTIIYTNSEKESVIDALADYLEGQLSDGWGEGFEQQEVTSATVYAVYNENDDTDCEFFADERRAVHDYENKNADNEYEDEDDEDYFDSSDQASYDWCSVDVHVYCSFWERGRETIVKTYINGFDADGYDEDGYDTKGYDRHGRDKDGYDKTGYDVTGRDKEGFDKEGFNRDGLDRDGYDRSGKKDLPDSRPAYGKEGKKQGALLQKDRSGKITVKNTFDMGEAAKKGKKKVVKEAVDPEFIATPEAAVDTASMFRFDMLRDTVFTDADCYANSDCTVYDYQDCLNEVFPTFLGVETYEDAIQVLEAAKDAGDLEAAENLDILRKSHAIVYGE